MLHVGRALRDLVSHLFKNLEVLLFSVLLGHTAGGNVIQVLEPLEVRAGDAATVGKHVRHGDDASLKERLFGGKGGGAVSTLNYDFALKVVTVLLVDDLLDGGRDQDVALELHELVGVHIGLSGGSVVALKSATLVPPVLDGVNIQTTWVVNGRVVLDNANNFSTVLLHELGSPVADSAESLDDDSLASKTLTIKVRLLNEGGHAEELLGAVVDTEASGLSAAFNATLGGELTSHTTLSIDVSLTVHVNVGVLDPGHNLFSGAEIWAEAVNLGSNEALLGEFHGISSRDSLDFTLGVLLGVNFNSTLCAAEGNVSDRQLESHEGGEGHHLLEIDVLIVPGAALHGELVVLVLGTVAEDLLHLAVIALDWDGEADHVVADLDHVQVVLGDVGSRGSAVEEEFDLLQETGLTILVETGAHGSSGEVATSYTTPFESVIEAIWFSFL
jgi:hypothetical protein